MSSTSPSTPSPDSASAADSGDFRIQAPIEILGLLQRLQQERTPLILSSPDGLSLSTRICELDADAGRMLLDSPAPGSPLPALLGAQELTAVAYLDQIRLQFDLDGLMLLQANPSAGPDDLLRADLPVQLYRFQRRQAFRVRPTSRTPQAHVCVPGADEAAPITLSLRVLDLSLGGLALLLPPEQPAPATGQLLQAVRVELDRHTRLMVDLRLQHVRAQADGSRQLGLTFENLDPLAERDLQHYVDQAQKMARLLRQPKASA